MTLAPVHSVEIRGVAGPPGPLAKHCAAVGCLKLTRDRHHLWSKSYLRGQPYEWVSLPDGRIVQNSIGLCVDHHLMVTGDRGGHKASILYQDGTFYWAELGNWAGEENWEIQGPINPQPGEGVEAEHPVTSAHVDLAVGETCPSCGYTKPRATTPRPRRPSQSWMVVVPADAELGAEVLDEWVDNFAALFGFTQETQRLKRYHVLAMVLAWAAQNKPAMIEDIIESQRR
jgi:hypothetical protein